MDGVIILKNADFSAKNIGKINLLSNTTKNILAKQRKYSADSEQAAVINECVNELTAKGYIGGNDPLLKVLMLPCLAASLDEAFYNIARVNEEGHPIDWKPENTEPYAIENGNLYCSASLGTEWRVPDNRCFSLGEELFIAGQSLPEFSIIHYLDKVAQDGVNTQEKNVVASVTTALEIIKCGCKATISHGTAFNVSVQTDDYSENAVMEKGFYGMSVLNNDNYRGLMLNCNGKTASTESQFGNLPTNTTDISICNNNFALLQGATIGTRAKAKMIAFGKGMTPAQMAELKSICDTFFNSLA